MDFLDSLDLHTTDKKSNRVRSWYLYEQYKSLEKNQLSAAQKLKNRSYQERILHRELNERRARRKLSEEFYHHHNDCRTDTSIKSDTRSPYAESTDSFFESICEQEDVVSAKKQEDTIREHSETSKFDDNFKSFNDKIDDNSFSESITSVLINNKTNQNVADDIKEELEIVKQNITEIINLQLEAEKECFEKITDLHGCDKDQENECVKSCKKYDMKLKTAIDKYAPQYENGFLAVWSKLVMFSYKLMQNNRGNCYSDFTSQFLTAVLAFDVLRRGINKMCHILQPYISPIKFADDISTEPYNINENMIHDQSNSSKSSENIRRYHPYSVSKLKMKPRLCERKYRSEEKWQCSCKYTFQNRINDIKHRGISEPYRSVARLSSDKQSTDQFPETYPRHLYKCPHMKKALKPIVKLSRYIDMILHEIED